jgi:hypothetical protein
LCSVHCRGEKAEWRCFQNNSILYSTLYGQSSFWTVQFLDSTVSGQYNFLTIQAQPAGPLPLQPRWQQRLPATPPATPARYASSNACPLRLQPVAAAISDPINKSATTTHMYSSAAPRTSFRARRPADLPPRVIHLVEILNRLFLMR